MNQNWSSFTQQLMHIRVKNMAEITWIVVVSTLLVTVVHFVVRRQRIRRWQKAQGIPPGSMGLPLLGESLQFLLRSQQFVQKRMRLHGKMFSTSVLGHPTIFSTDPQINKWVLNNDGILFAPRYPSSLTKLMGKWNMGSARGDFHKKMRGVALSFLNTAALKDGLLLQIENVVISNLKSWRGRIVNVIDETQDMTFSFMARQLIGLSPGELLETLKRDYNVFKKGLVTLPIKAPGTPYSKSFQKRQELLKQIQNIIEDRRKTSFDVQEDLLSMLLQNRENEGNKFQLTTEQILDLILGLLFAGYDTTSRTMALVVKHLSQNPQVIPQLRVEHETIRRKKEENEMLSWTDYKSMVFTRDVIKETLRLGLGIDVGLFRESLANVEIGGYTIPKGWTFIMYGRSASLDNKYYEDPLRFNPWRWQKDDVNQALFAPFGGGIRLCPGNELAMLEVSFFIHHLVTKFKWEWIAPLEKTSWFNSSFTSLNNIRILPEPL